jgi:hypothetical protein
VNIAVKCRVVVIKIETVCEVIASLKVKIAVKRLSPGILCSVALQILTTVSEEAVSSLEMLVSIY